MSLSSAKHRWGVATCVAVVLATCVGAARGGPRAAAGLSGRPPPPTAPETESGLGAASPATSPGSNRPITPGMKTATGSCHISVSTTSR